MDAEQVLAFRLARSGLARRAVGRLADAVACPASDFSRDAALLSVAARHEGLTRERYDDAVERGELFLAHSLRGAIHVQAPADSTLYGRALIATDEDELVVQLGQQVQRLAVEAGFAATDALEEVAGATRAALASDRRLDKNELHQELRARVGAHVMPWCERCGSHHVAPMLWRYGAVAAGARLDPSRRYVLGKGGERTPRDGEAVRRFLAFYGPATAGDFADWTGVARPHGSRLWEEVAGELEEVAVDKRKAWLLREDLAALGSPPAAGGVRLIPPGDPYLQRPNRALLTPEAELRKRLFRPVASPGAGLKDGRLAGLWRVKARERKTEITVERLGPLASADLEDEARRVAELRGAREFLLAVD